ncbi:MAG: hypothetical protein KatS3mg129_0254 [Leptospiraceae bacterium]|nr:MAG: hypothetical protein KatS3mg129_0254 [Leptospiraceae bacterium]
MKKQSIENYFKSYKTSAMISLKEYRLLKDFLELTKQNNHLQIYISEKEKNKLLLSIKSNQS